jgi:ABC-2 type transport system ATP-binding protein
VTDAIVFEKVSKRFGSVLAVKEVSLRVSPGSFVGLIGHNGAGKTTCLNMLMGLLRPTEGQIRIQGFDVFENPLACRQQVGAVPENMPLYEYLSAQEYFEFVAEVRGAGDVAAALDIAGLGTDADRLIREYSQGMRRRTALAAALISEPSVLLLDEALNGLDPPSAARMKGILRDRVEGGATVVLSTHAVETVRQAADRVVMLAHGKIVADAQTSEFKAGELEAAFLEKLKP